MRPPAPRVTVSTSAPARQAHQDDVGGLRQPRASDVATPRRPPPAGPAAQAGLEADDLHVPFFAMFRHIASPITPRPMNPMVEIVMGCNLLSCTTPQAQS